VLLLVTLDGFKGGLSDWAPAAEWAVALGTFGLALATLRLAARAKAEAEAMGDSVKIQTRQLAASDLPCVYPITDHTWLETRGEGGRWLAFQNGGTGVARNIKGYVRWSVEGGEAALIGQTLGAGQHSRVRVGEEKRIHDWSGVEGHRETWMIGRRRPGSLRGANRMPRALDNGQRSPNKLLADLVRKLVAALRRS
jgi:hypothetical protein